jgi:hypothetical protein
MFYDEIITAIHSLHGALILIRADPNCLSNSLSTEQTQKILKTLSTLPSDVVELEMLLRLNLLKE